MYIVTYHLNRLAEVVLMNSHNTCLWTNRTIYPQVIPTILIWSSGAPQPECLLTFFIITVIIIIIINLLSLLLILLLSPLANRYLRYLCKQNRKHQTFIEKRQKPRPHADGMRVLINRYHYLLLPMLVGCIVVLRPR